MKKSVHFILSTNAAEILVMLTATAAGLGVPLNPMQLLWINLVTDIFPGLALAVEPPETEVLNRSPRDPQEPMFSRRDLQRIGFEGTVITASAMTAYGWGLARYGVLSPRASTMAFTSLTAAQLLHTLSSRSTMHSLFSNKPYPHNSYVPLAVGSGLALQLLALFTPGLRALLGLTPLSVADWPIVLGMAVTPLFVSEMVKTTALLDNREEEVR